MALAKVTPACSVVCSDCVRSVVPNIAPLSPIARAKRPFAIGDAISADTENDPADSPAMVTRPGSPPNAAMFVFTHRSAAT